jgi:hypothetical protein
MNRTAHRLATATALVLVVLVSATAQARIPVSESPTPSVQGRGATAANQAAVPPATQDRGFHWGDAAIGAAAGVAIVLVAFGLTLVVRDRPGVRRSVLRQM